MDIFDDGIIALDPGGHIVRLNPAAARLFGWRQPSAHTKSWMESAVTCGGRAPLNR